MAKDSIAAGRMATSNPCRVRSGNCRVGTGTSLARLAGSAPQALPLEERSNNPYNQYAVSKLAAEKTALGLGWLHGIPTVALRYSITQGKRQSLYNHYSGVCRIFCTRALQQSAPDSV